MNRKLSEWRESRRQEKLHKKMQKTKIRSRNFWLDASLTESQCLWLKANDFCEKASDFVIGLEF